MMAYKGKGMVTRMDRIAMAVTGQNAETGINPRLSIIANLIFMATGIAGLVITAQGHFGPGLAFAAMIASSTHTVIIEYAKRGDAPLDERERVIAWKSMAIGAFVPCAIVGMWALLLGNFADNGLWYPDQSSEWQVLAFFILGLMTQITNIATAWLTPSYAAELLDED